jgi:hypothetical protein
MIGHRTACALNEQATAFVLYALEPEQELAVRAHLPGCGSCQEVVRATEAVAQELAGSVEQVDPPPWLRTDVLAAAGALAAGRSPAPRPAALALPPRSRPDRPVRRPARRRRAVRALVAAAVLAVAGLTGYSAHLQEQRAAEVARVAALTSLVTRLDGPATVLRTDTGDSVAAVLSTADGPAVVASGLRPNDPTRSVYVVWGISAAAPRALGTLDVTGADPGVLTLPPAAGPFLGYAISLEPGRAAPTAPTAVVASGQVS